MKLEIRRNLFSVLAFVGFIWLIYLINLPLSVTSWTLLNYGLLPRTIPGLVGVFSMPFLHEGIDHLLGNTVPLAVLLLMLAMTRPNARRILISLIVLSGILTWLLAVSSPVVGASGLIYALTAYLITAGLLERKLASAGAAVLVGVLYGTLFWGLLPTAGKGIAWDAHLLGAVAGAAFGYLTLRQKSKKTVNDEPATMKASTSEPAM
jgi:membrane associated rhomboid family serine protease